jgi:hypothetical protein
MNISAENLRKLKSDGQYQVPVQLFQPWSAPVMKTILPPDVFSSILEITDLVVGDSGTPNYGHTLAGQIEDELELPLTILNQTGLKGFFEGLVRQYLIICKNQSNPFGSINFAPSDWAVEIINSWIVSQRPNEYNPVHLHRGQISAVIYLKMPDILPGRKSSRPDDDGSIAFISGPGRDKDLTSPTLSIKPQIAEMYLFGAGQLHTVYPFRCPENESDPERRSVSFNATFHELSEEMA